MFDLGWTELMVIGIVALIVVGPKDLPGMFQAVGKFVGKAKGMAREFSKAMNDAADDSGVGDIASTLKKAASPMSSAMDEVKKSTESFTQQTMNSGKPKLSAERQEKADKIAKKAAELATERQANEAEAQAAHAKKTAAKKTAAKKAPSKKAPAKAPAAKAAPARKTAAKAPAKKPAAKKPAAKKPAAKDKA